MWRNFFEAADVFVRQAVDCSNIEPMTLSASNTKPDVYEVTVDFREGNTLIMLLEHERVCVYYPVEDVDLIGALYYFISHFEEMKTCVPEEGTFTIQVLLTDDKEIILTEEIINDFYQTLEMTN